MHRKRFLLMLTTAVAVAAISLFGCNTNAGNNGENPETIHYHHYQDGACKDCGTKLAVTVGLEYELNENETEYSVKSLGTADALDIVIPSQYNGLPVTKLTQTAFYKSNKIKSIYLPSSINEISDSAFWGCNELGAITVATDNEYFSSVNDCLLSDGGKTLRLGCKNSVVPKGVTEIYYYAFAPCKSLTKITLPETVTTIDGFVFLDCTALTEITLPAGLNTIGIFAFRNCNSLKTINYQGTTSQWESILKANSWDQGIGSYTVRCSDGGIDKIID